MCHGLRLPADGPSHRALRAPYQKETAMPVLAPERAEEILAGWRRGVDEDGLASPAGPLFDGYAESDITLTGGGPCPTTSSATCKSEIVIIEPLCPPCC